MNAENTSGQGMGFTSVLLLIFIVLKLTNVINWSWWWVLSPFWITLAFAAIVFLIYLIYKAYN
jgi:membrane protein YdbS with pleckstrin-like domain